MSFGIIVRMFEKEIINLTVWRSQIEAEAGEDAGTDSDDDDEDAGDDGDFYPFITRFSLN